MLLPLCPRFGLLVRWTLTSLPDLCDGEPTRIGFRESLLQGLTGRITPVWIHSSGFQSCTCPHGLSFRLVQEGAQHPSWPSGPFPSPSPPFLALPSPLPPLLLPPICIFFSLLYLPLGSAILILTHTPISLPSWWGKGHVDASSHFHFSKHIPYMDFLPISTSPHPHFIPKLTTSWFLLWKLSWSFSLRWLNASRDNAAALSLHPSCSIHSSPQALFENL